MPQSIAAHRQTIAQHMPSFIPLNLEQRTHLDTSCAAHHLGRKAQTMRVWASTEQGPIRPVRINGRLAWPIKDIRQILSGTSKPY